MQQMNQAAGWGGAERTRVEAVVETLAASCNKSENLAEVAHDARNMVTALGLYCDLLEEPGVLAAPYAHYGSELRLVAAASRRLVERLVALDAEMDPEAVAGLAGVLDMGKRPVKVEPEERSRSARRWELMPALLIDSLAGELMANRNLLAALAGPSIALTVDTEGGALPVRLTGEDLTRILVNLVKNAAEAMPSGGKILLRLRERAAVEPRFLTLTIDDSGPGIPAKALDRVFEAGFSTQSGSGNNAGWSAAHRGLGLSITRSIIEAAGGRITAANREPARDSTRDPVGAHMEIELPVRTR
ncbi:MAG TPA: sensor histidine kinase [Terracidiphilus sp.]|jgi:signal transduction histidine kinase